MSCSNSRFSHILDNRLATVVAAEVPRPFSSTKGGFHICIESTWILFREGPKVISHAPISWREKGKRRRRQQLRDKKQLVVFPRYHNLPPKRRLIDVQKRFMPIKSLTSDTFSIPNIPDLS